MAVIKAKMTLGRLMINVGEWWDFVGEAPNPKGELFEAYNTTLKIYKGSSGTLNISAPLA